MNAVSGLDAAWANRVSGKAMFMCIDRVMIAGEEWKVLGCPLILENRDMPKAYDIDHDAREIRINAAYNAAYSGPSIVEAVCEIWRDKVLRSIEDFAERMDGAAA